MVFIKENVLKQFETKDEKMAFSKVADLAEYSINNKKNEFSEFFDPVKASKYLSIIKKYINKNTYLFGGMEESERVTLGFFQEDYILDYEDFPIDIVEISYNNKFIKPLSHREYLGSILSLGIERSKVGDIIVLEKKAYVFILNDISDYIIFNLEKVSNTKVNCIKVKHIDGVDDKNSVQKKLTVPSLRLDAVISDSFNISRNKASEYIKSEKVFLNWVCISNNSKEVKEGDVVTLRGLGRIKVEEVIGKTKKDRISILISKKGTK